MTENRAVTAMVTRLTISGTESHRADEDTATASRPVVAVMGTRETATGRRDKAMATLRMMDVRTPCIHTSPQETDGIGCRTGR
ncbi:hypothetical protein A5675_21255 [Mycobacterium malmoense]|uniref:Uncharacterized protein n=1 Tax=Mycobacterium malmoense TaxID=1780 RepID=A0A1B9D1Z6_MYCMA|nr:hypothetical protein A5675_21255 [Mycobacterium malmoense]OCB49102.1 hypothetical protein A5677_03450 [Mycobacterium malmoense]